MAEAEVSVISHLLSVEAQASILVKEAQEEAAKRLSDARNQADTDFKQRFESIVQQEEQSYNEKISSLTENHKKNIEDYKSSIEKTEQNKNVFNAFLKKVLTEQ